MMTKQEEIEMFRSFVAALPRSGYLPGLLDGLVDMVERSIMSDFDASLVGSLGALWREKEQTRRETLELEKLKAALQSEYDDLVWRKDAITREINGLREKAMRVAHAAA